MHENHITPFNKDPTFFYQKQIQQVIKKCDILIDKCINKYLINVNTQLFLHYVMPKCLYICSEGFLLLTVKNNKRTAKVLCFLHFIVHLTLQFNLHAATVGSQLHGSDSVHFLYQPILSS